MSTQIVWEGGTGDPGEHAITLKIALQDVAPGHHKWRAGPTSSADGTTVETLVINPSGQPAPRQVTARVRHDEAPELLNNMIEAGLDGIVQTIIPDDTDQDHSYSATMMSARGIGVEREGRQNAYSVSQIVWRVTSGEPIQ